MTKLIAFKVIKQTQLEQGLCVHNHKFKLLVMLTNKNKKIQKNQYIVLLYRERN